MYNKVDGDNWLRRIYNAFDGECMFIEHTLQKRSNNVTIRGDHQGGVDECLSSHMKLYANVINNHLKVGDRVLSVGAGGGIADRSYFIATGEPVVAVDLQKSTETAELLYPCPGVVRVVHDAREPFPPAVVEMGPFSKVLLVDIYEHLNKRSGMLMVGRVSKLMDPDGVVLVSTPVQEIGAHDSNKFHLREFYSKLEVLSEVQRQLSDGQVALWAHDK